MNEELAKRFKHNLQKLIGKKCWGIVNSAGSHISFDFGEKILRKKPIDNENLSSDVSLYEAELSFLIFCVWRFESAKQVICGAWSESKESVNQILNEKVIEVIFEEPSFDLTLTFSNGLSFKVFCDSTNELDEFDNYDFFTAKEIYSVKMYSHLAVDAREIEK